MGKERTAELTEQLELVPDATKKERPKREDYDLAELYAERLFPKPPEGMEDRHKRQRDGAIKTALSHFSQLCGKKAEANKYIKYDYKEVYLAWESLYEKYLDEQDIPGLWKHPPTLLGVAYGANPWIETWRAEILNNLPPVYESFIHDLYVKKYAHVLKAFGWKYGATGQPNRLSRETVEELGL